MGFICSGCYYEEWVPSVAYPGWTPGTGGGFWGLHKDAEFYQDWHKQQEEAKRKFREAKEEADKERWAEFAKKFAQGFFGFSDSDSEAKAKEEHSDKDYPYSVFGLKRSASEEDVKKAYRKKILKAHPDKGGTNELFRKIRDAWEYFSRNCQGI